MKKTIFIGTILTVAILILASFPSVLGYSSKTQDKKSFPNQNTPLINHISKKSQSSRGLFSLISLLIKTYCLIAFITFIPWFLYEVAGSNYHPLEAFFVALLPAILWPITDLFMLFLLYLISIMPPIPL